MFKNFVQMLGKVKERAGLAYITVILAFAVIFYVLSDKTITSDEMGIVTAVTTLAGFVYGYYFGQSKSETDRQSIEHELKKSGKPNE